MNVFQVLINPEKEELQGGERGVVCSAANVLQMGEFQFLQLAYRDWFGEELPDALSDGLFASYMLRNEVPHWARHYARSILAEQATRGLEAGGSSRHHRVHGRPNRAPEKGAAVWLAAGAVALAVAGVIAAAGLTTAASTSVLPPYFARGELPHAGGTLTPAAGKHR